MDERDPSSGKIPLATAADAGPPSARRAPFSAMAYLIALLALACLAVLPRLLPRTHGMVGKPAPDATFAVAANGAVGSKMRLADLKGRPVLLDFWASWCGPCGMVAPIVDRVARRYEARGLVVMGVNVDDAPSTIRAYAAAKGLRYPMVVDADKQTSSRYGVSQLPTLVVIDREGNVRAFLTGLVDEAALNEILGAVM